MSKKTKPAHDLKKIREIMEKSTTFLSLSGFSGIFAGVVGCIAGTIILRKMGSMWISTIFLKELMTDDSLKIFFLILFLSTIFLAVLGSFIITALNSIRNKLNIWDLSSRRFAENLFIPLISGGILLTGFYINKSYEYILPIMLIFFGLSLINASKFTKEEIKILGIFQIILGLISVFIIPLGLICWILGFGLMNIIYGIFMYMKYER